MTEISIDGQVIGCGLPPYIIAELSANHNGDIRRAFDTISEAKKRGAHAIKLQTYSPDTMTIDCDNDDFKVKGGLWDGYTLYDLYKEAQTPFDWHKRLFEHARSVGLTCFSTPFDETAVDLLEDLNAPAYKLASFEATDLPLVRYIASTKKPLIMSTGMADLDEITEMVHVARDAGSNQIIVLHCISSYPAPLNQSNLLTIPDLRERLGVPIGLSDHTIGNVASVVGVSLGASVIEKHFTLDRRDKGPDSEFSIMPSELGALVSETFDAWQSLGDAGYEKKPAEEENTRFRRSIYFVRDIKAGQRVSSDCIRRIRPGYGLPPKYFEDIVGRVLTRDVKRGDATSWDCFSDG